jgi:hypothetical protein
MRYDLIRHKTGFNPVFLCKGMERSLALIVAIRVLELQL